MSYQLDLDEYTEEALLKELFSRREARRQGKCDYCGRPEGVKPVCKFPERHNFNAETTIAKALKLPKPPKLKLTCEHFMRPDTKKKCMRCKRKGCAACSLCPNCQP